MQCSRILCAVDSFVLANAKATGSSALSRGTGSLTALTSPRSERCIGGEVQSSQPSVTRRHGTPDRNWLVGALSRPMNAVQCGADHNLGYSQGDCGFFVSSFSRLCSSATLLWTQWCDSGGTRDELFSADQAYDFDRLPSSPIGCLSCLCQRRQRSSPTQAEWLVAGSGVDVCTPE